MHINCGRLLMVLQGKNGAKGRFVRLVLYTHTHTHTHTHWIYRESMRIGYDISKRHKINDGMK